MGRFSWAKEVLSECRAVRGEGGVNARKEEKVSGAFLVGVNGYRE